jgi:hypothetical protein
MTGDDEERGGPDDGAGREVDERGTPEPGAADTGARGEEKSGTFLVTAADEGSAVLSDVADGQVHPLSANPGFQEGEVAVATLAPEGPLGVTWYPVEVTERWAPAIEAVEEPPGARARELAGDEGAGGLSRASIEGGELHVIAVEASRTEAAVADVLADETTLRIAARLGARRVEVRGEAGVVGVRYLTPG